ncbi:isocitrate lyase/phosphoenolpyruvate mutase family protein [Streptomyces sp. ISL-11]|uniref:isocitrate lyase/PEP mutase family protein n=1 Tax=Streptomyces sp. ISL-11 TaxID=2819174 RepID=UPI001BEBA3C3|nr:isocitrate lyase/phosphoenolpyruvate mutase family protein [Streptomyces sp. ISL-11]MBT2384810.1 isocitrate lyase/phosphoenolpyruvate mutase family protein [Streptomyces sp. ISL-11]
MTAAAFRALHRVRGADGPLVLPGPWDAASARAFADAGFPALATPSAGVSASLGYADGAAPPAEMFAAVARIARAVDVPVSADIEDGYGLPARELVARLLETGAVGCNLEDSDRAGHGLKDPREQADRLAEIRAEAGDALVVNARVDTFLWGDRDLTSALARARLYAEAGADCLFPIVAPPEFLAPIAAETGLPVNALAQPGGLTPRELGARGASRVTFGGGLHRSAMAVVERIAAGLRVT